MEFKFKSIGILIITSLIFSIINFKEYLMGSIPNSYNAIFSILFILLWFLYGLFMSYRKLRYFIKFSTLYWGIGVLLLVVSYILSLYIIFVPAAIIFVGPIYGIRYFIRIPSDIKFVVISISITYIFSITGYWIGKCIKRLSTRTHGGY